MPRLPQPYQTITVIQDNGIETTGWRLCAMGVRHHPKSGCSCGQMGNLGLLLPPGEHTQLFIMDDVGAMTPEVRHLMERLMASTRSTPVPWYFINPSIHPQLSNNVAAEFSAEYRRITEPAPVYHVMTDPIRSVLAGLSAKALGDYCYKLPISMLLKWGLVEMVPAEVLRTNDTDMLVHQGPLEHLVYQVPLERPQDMWRRTGALGVADTHMPYFTADWLHREPQLYSNQGGATYDPERWRVVWRPEFSRCMCGHLAYMDRYGRERYEGYDIGVDPHRLQYDPIVERRYRGPVKGLMLQA